MAAAIFVVTITWEIAIALSAPVAASCDPGLKPNHPNQSMNTPNEPRVRLCPGIATDFPDFVYLPILGPNTIAPARARNPPQACTTVEPAKSWNPIALNHPPP